MPSTVRVNFSEDVNFSKIKGMPPSRKAIVLELASNPLVNRVITIEGSGMVSRASNIPQWTIITVDSNVSFNGATPSLAFGQDGFVRISYAGAGLKFARCTNADCTTKNITPVDSSGSVGYEPSIAIGQDGFARISYGAFSTNSRLRFAQCANADCTTRNITIVDSNGYDSSIAIGQDGFAGISYTDFTNGDLKFAKQKW